MSRRRTRLAARFFRGESVAFEACAGFRAGVTEHVCHCGWLADDHRPTAPTGSTGGRRSPLPVVAFARWPS